MAVFMKGDLIMAFEFLKRFVNNSDDKDNLDNTKFRKQCAKSALTEEQTTLAYEYYDMSHNMEWSISNAKLDFDSEQMEEARLGFENGLTQEQVELYYKPEYTWSQMSVAENGFENGLTLEQVSLYYKPEYTWEQMLMAMEGFKNGLTLEQVALYYKPEFDYGQMYIAREGFENGLTQGEILSKLEASESTGDSSLEDFSKEENSLGFSDLF